MAVSCLSAINAVPLVLIVPPDAQATVRAMWLCRMPRELVQRGAVIKCTAICPCQPSPTTVATRLRVGGATNPGLVGAGTVQQFFENGVLGKDVHTCQMPTLPNTLRLCLAPCFALTSVHHYLDTLTVTV